MKIQTFIIYLVFLFKVFTATKRKHIYFSVKKSLEFS